MNIKERIEKINKSHLLIAGVLLLVLLAGSLLWFNDNNSSQAQPTLHIELYFKGEYRIAEGHGRPTWRESIFRLQRET